MVGAFNVEAVPCTRRHISAVAEGRQEMRGKAGAGMCGELDAMSKALYDEDTSNFPTVLPVQWTRKVLGRG